MSGGHLQALLFMMNQPEPIRQSSLLMVLATGIGHAPSLMGGLKALAEESNGAWASKLEQLRALLSQGQTLSEALTTARDLLPEQSLVAIRIAEQTGSLKQVLADEAQRLMQRGTEGNPVRPTFAMTVVWLLGLGAVALCVVSFVMIFIIPKFKRIFEGFGVELPNLTILLISLSDWTMSYWYLILFPAFSLLCFLAWLMFMASLRYLKTGHVMFSENHPRYWTPMILRLLSVVVSTGKSLGEGIHCILKELEPGRTSRQLSGVRQSVYAGVNCWDALRSHGFLNRREVRFLESSAKTHHLDWGLQHLSRSLELRRGRWVRWLQAVVQPTSILMAGIIVAFIVIALFLPLIKLLNDLS